MILDRLVVEPECFKKYRPLVCDLVASGLLECIYYHQWTEGIVLWLEQRGVPLQTRQDALALAVVVQSHRPSPRLTKDRIWFANQLWRAWCGIRNRYHERSRMSEAEVAMFRAEARRTAKRDVGSAAPSGLRLSEEGEWSVFGVDIDYPE